MSALAGSAVWVSPASVSVINMGEYPLEYVDPDEAAFWAEINRKSDVPVLNYLKAHNQRVRDATLAPIVELALAWERDAASYPLNVEGQYAAAAVRACRKELFAAIKEANEAIKEANDE